MAAGPGSRGAGRPLRSPRHQPGRPNPMGRREQSGPRDGRCPGTWPSAIGADQRVQPYPPRHREHQGAVLPKAPPPRPLNARGQSHPHRPPDAAADAAEVPNRLHPRRGDRPRPPVRTGSRRTPRLHVLRTGGGLLMSQTKAAPYRSTSCRIGTHHECAHSCPTTAPVGVPVVYETCTCPCHAPTASTIPTGTAS